MERFPPIPAAVAVIRAAALLLPVREIAGQQNHGRFVEAILASTGNEPGQPWCASAVYYVGNGELGKAWPLPRTASCDVLLEFAFATGMLYGNTLAMDMLVKGKRLTPEAGLQRTSPPKFGDVFLRMKSPVDATHTGFVNTPLAPAAGFHTYEGNAADPLLPPSDNGDGFYARVRGNDADPAKKWVSDRQTPYCYIRWHEV